MVMSALMIAFHIGAWNPFAQAAEPKPVPIMIPVEARVNGCGDLKVALRAVESVIPESLGVVNGSRQFSESAQRAMATIDGLVPSVGRFVARWTGEAGLRDHVYGPQGMNPGLVDTIYVDGFSQLHTEYMRYQRQRGLTQPTKWLYGSLHGMAGGLEKLIERCELIQ